MQMHLMELEEKSRKGRKLVNFFVTYNVILVSFFQISLAQEIEVARKDANFANSPLCKYQFGQYLLKFSNFL